MIAFNRSVQGVLPEADQQPKSTRWIGGAHKMDFLSPVLAFSCNAISIRVYGFDVY